MLNEKDPNDSVKISFTIDEELVGWMDGRLKILKDYDPGFYCQETIRTVGILYQITTKYRNIHSDEYKRFMFQVKLKLGHDVKIR